MNYLKLIESYEKVDHLSYEKIMIGVKARVDQWHAIPAADSDRLWETSDGSLLMTLTKVKEVDEFVLPLNEQMAADMIMAEFAHEIWSMLPARYVQAGLETPFGFSEEDCRFVMAAMSVQASTPWRQRFERLFLHSEEVKPWTEMKYLARLKQMTESGRYDVHELHTQMWKIFQRWYAIPSQNRRRVWHGKGGRVSMQRN